MATYRPQNQWKTEQHKGKQKKNQQKEHVNGWNIPIIDNIQLTNGIEH